MRVEFKKLTATAWIAVVKYEDGETEQTSLRIQKFGSTTWTIYFMNRVVRTVSGLKNAKVQAEKVVRKRYE